MQNNLLPKKLRIKFLAYKYGLYAFIFLMIFAFAFLFGKHIEAIFLFVSFVFLRYKFPTTFHHNSTYWCVFWSIFSFWVCIVAVLPLQYSILSGAVVELILCFILYKVQDYTDVKNALKEARTPKISIYSCSKDEFVSICLESKVRHNRIEYVWDIIRGTEQDEDVANRYFVDPQTIKQDRWRYKKKLQKYIDNPS